MTELYRADQRLKAARLAAGYRTAKEFADKNGFAVVTVQKHEKGKEAGGRGLSRAQADKYARALAKTLPDVAADWLLYGRGEPPVGVLGPPRRPGKSPRASIVGGRETDAAGRRYPGEFRQDADPDPILDAPEVAAIEPRRLIEVVTRLEEYLDRHRLRLAPDRKALLVVTLYGLAARAGDHEPVDVARYSNVIRLAL